MQARVAQLATAPAAPSGSAAPAASAMSQLDRIEAKIDYSIRRLERLMGGVAHVNENVISSATAAGLP
jgi:hypothetical protein